jgi:hypothetical protein
MTPKLCAGLAFLVLSLTDSTSVMLAAEPPLSSPAPARPNAEAGPTEVTIAAWFADISKIDSAAQTCSANLVLVMKWKDPQLARPGDQTKTYPVANVWHPRWLIANEGDSLRRSLPESIDVAPDGSAVYRQRLIGSFAQTLDLRKFPFDRAPLRVTLAMVGVSPGEIALKADPSLLGSGTHPGIAVAKTLTLQDWSVSGFKAYAQPYKISPDYVLPGYVLEFTAVRRVQHYALKVIMPLILIHDVLAGVLD